MKKQIPIETLRATTSEGGYLARLFEQYQDGDELWEFSSSQASWENLAGRSGLALVRHGEIVDSIVTVLN